MKRKTNTVEAAPLPTCSAIGPDDMVLVACSSGESYLIERNCALLSVHCREVLLLWESHIRRIASQNRSDQSTLTPAITPTSEAPAAVVGFPGNERSGTIRSLIEPTEGTNMTIPFMAAWDDAGDATSGTVEAMVHHIPLLRVAERYQQRLDAATPSKVDRPTSSKNPSSHGDRKGVMVVPKPISPLVPLEDERGVLLYPVVELAHVTPSLMESSLAYASKKYKVDIDGERMPAELVPAVNAIVTGEQWHTIAAAVLTGM